MAEPKPRKLTAFDLSVLVLVVTACVGILAFICVFGDTLGTCWTDSEQRVGDRAVFIISRSSFRTIVHQRRTWL